MSEKPVSEMTTEELLRWFEQRRQQPLYVGSDEYEGMSFCYVNPAIVEEESPKENALAKKEEPALPTPPAAKEKVEMDRG